MPENRTLRVLRAKLAAHESWANTDDRSARTAPARRAADDRFVREARERYGDLPDEELATRAAHIRTAYFTRLSLKSAQARRARKATPSTEVA